MPQIDFFVLSRLSTVILVTLLFSFFLLIHLVLLKRGIKSAVKIAFLGTLMGDLRFIKAHIAQFAAAGYSAGDFLEQFVIVFNPVFVLGLTFLIFALMAVFSTFEWLADLFINVFKGVMHGYSTLEILYLRKFSLFFLGTFVVVFMFNILGMLPFAFTFTSSLSVPFFVALSTFFIGFVSVFVKNPVKSFKFFLHGGTNVYISPLIVLIEIISHFSKFVSLAVRLFANMFAGHLLLKAFYSFVFVLFANISLLNFFYALFVIGFTLFIVSLEFLIAFLQAYVALLLIVLYISGSRSFSLEH